MCGAPPRSDRPYDPPDCAAILPKPTSEAGVPKPGLKPGKSIIWHRAPSRLDAAAGANETCIPTLKRLPCPLRSAHAFCHVAWTHLPCAAVWPWTKSSTGG